MTLVFAVIICYEYNSMMKNRIKISSIMSFFPLKRVYEFGEWVTPIC